MTQNAAHHVRRGGWLFLMPEEVDSAGTPPGPQVSQTGGIDIVEDAQVVRQAILLLLRTRPGERVMRPTYGCDIHRLLFTPNDDTTAGLAAHYVRRALEQWEPRIDLLNVDAGRDPHNPDALLITVEYLVRSTRQVDNLELSLHLAGA